jgi:hypothetical protein
MTTASQVPVQSPELQSKLAQWRQKSIDGTITLEELKEAVRIMRSDRHAALDAQMKSASGAKRTAKAPVDTAKLLSDLENL